jgi:hypothetical protein
VSRDEEHVELRVHAGASMFDLGERAHHYLLPILARRRLGDTAEGLVETSCGWVYQEDLAHDPTRAPSELNIDVFRIRKQFAAIGVLDAAGIGPATLWDQASGAFAAATRVVAAPVTPSTLDLQLARHGLIAPALRAELRSRVLHDVIAPCADALLESPATRSARVEIESPAAHVGQVRPLSAQRG